MFELIFIVSVISWFLALVCYMKLIKSVYGSFLGRGGFTEYMQLIVFNIDKSLTKKQLWLRKLTVVWVVVFLLLIFSFNFIQY